MLFIQVRLVWASTHWLLMYFIMFGMFSRLCHVFNELIFRLLLKPNLKLVQNWLVSLCLSSECFRFAKVYVSALTTKAIFFMNVSVANVALSARPAQVLVYYWVDWAGKYKYILSTLKVVSKLCNARQQEKVKSKTKKYDASEVLKIDTLSKRWTVQSRIVKPFLLHLLSVKGDYHTLLCTETY